MVAKTTQHNVAERARPGKIRSKTSNGNARTRMGLKATADATSPCKRQCKARAVPHPGHFSPVSKKTGQRGKNGISSGLYRKSATARTRAATPMHKSNGFLEARRAMRPSMWNFHFPPTDKLFRRGRKDCRNDCRSNRNDVYQSADDDASPHPC